MFVKGDARINREGRPIGSKTREYLQPKYWHDLIMAEWKKLKPSGRAAIAMRGFMTVMPKNLGPQTSDDSVQYAESAYKMLKLLQEVSRNGSNNGNVSGGDPIGLEHRRPSPQVIEASTQRL